MNKPLSLLLRAGLSLGLALPLLAPVATHAGEKAEVHGSCGKIVMKAKKMAGAPTVNLRLRDGACLNGTKVMKVLPAGTSVTILGETNGWYKVSYDGMNGWMSAEYVEASDAVAEKKEKQAATVVKDAVLGKRPMVGITEADFAKVEAKRAELLNRLKDKVLLRVQKKGETWYVEKDGSLTRVKMHGKNEFKRVSADVKKEGKKKVEEKKQVELPPAGSISLKAEVVGNMVKLAWVANVESPNGFKVVKSLDPNPEYPGDSAEYVDASTRSRELWLDSGKTYHVRVCRYTGSGCDSYSNDVEVVTK